MARITTRQLARLCNRLGTSLKAGVDIRRVLDRERQGKLVINRKMADVADRVENGTTLAEAMKSSQPYFPSLACELVDVGEQTGQLESVLLRLSDHYQHMLTLRRLLLTGIAWPLLQLLAGIMIIGGLILILGMIPNSEAKVFGLSGTSGLMTYILVVGSVIAVLVAVGMGLMRGWFGPLPTAFVMRLPAIGTSLKTMALARLSWTLSLALNAGIDAKQSLRLALESTQNRYFTKHHEAARRVIESNGQFHEALRTTGAFPEDFLDALETAEITGTESESLDRLSRDYQERAESSTKVLTVVASFAIWGIIAAILIFLIFSLAMNLYIGPINEALEMTGH